MTYPTVDAAESRADADRPALPAVPTSRERLRAALMLTGLLSLAAAFWIAVWCLAIT